MVIAPPLSPVAPPAKAVAAMFALLGATFLALIAIRAPSGIFRRATKSLSLIAALAKAIALVWSICSATIRARSISFGPAAFLACSVQPIMFSPSHLHHVFIGIVGFIFIVVMDNYFWIGRSGNQPVLQRPILVSYFLSEISAIDKSRADRFRLRVAELLVPLYRLCASNFSTVARDIESTIARAMTLAVIFTGRLINSRWHYFTASAGASMGYAFPTHPNGAV